MIPPNAMPEDLKPPVRPHLLTLPVWNHGSDTRVLEDTQAPNHKFDFLLYSRTYVGSVSLSFCTDGIHSVTAMVEIRRGLLGSSSRVNSGKQEGPTATESPKAWGPES